jgi:ubiquinone/menaquinone biosynthesis C-methylase UbiE
VAGLPKGFTRGLLFGALFALVWGVLADRRRRGAIGGEMIERAGMVPLVGPRLSAALSDRLMDGIYRAVAEDVVSQVRSGELLELASGSGRLAVELAHRARDLQITAMAPSADGVQLAEHRLSSAGLGRQVKVVHGTPTDIPFPDGSFDHVVCFRGFRKADAPERVLGEVYRVLRPGGKAWIYDFRRETPEEAWDLAREKLSLVMQQLFDSGIIASWRGAYNEAQIELYAAGSPFKEVTLEALSAEIVGVQVQALTKATFQR